MCRLGPAPIILSMTRPITSSRVLLVADRRPEADVSGDIPIRRYRLARLRFDARPADPEMRFEHLKRVYE